MKNLLYLFLAGVFFAATACGGGSSEEAVTEEAVTEEAATEEAANEDTNAVMEADSVEHDHSDHEHDHDHSH